MTTPPQRPAGESPAPRFDDPTRDIRLPSRPGRAPASIRPEWQAHVRRDEAETSSAPETVGPDSLPEHVPLANQPTDKMSAPPRARQQTLAFDAPSGGGPGAAAAQLPSSPAGAPPAAVGSPGPRPSASSGPQPFAPFGHGAPAYGSPGQGSRPAPARQRRWPWVVLTILPILVIIVSGLLLLWLLRGA